MFKKSIAFLLVLVMGVSIMWFANPLVPAVEASADTYRSGFSIIPEKEDATGISLDSGFILSSQTKVTLDWVKANVSFRDGTAISVTTLEDGRFSLKPYEQLKQNQVYFIDIKAHDGRTVTFAFQTKRDFTVIGSLPEMTASGVPVDTGIEIYFSYPDIQDLSKYFEISPKVEGRFENHGYTSVFIPKKLESGTVYTVKIKKGLTAANGAVSLKEDYTFSFETSQDTNNSANPFPGTLYLNKSWMEFASNEKPVVPFDIYLNNPPSSVDVTMTVYQYKNLDDFLKAIREKEKAPVWAPCAQSKSKVVTEGLSKVLEFKQSFNLQNWQSRFMMSPETLNEGFYLVELTSDKLSAQAFMQISDIASYSVSDKGNNLFWLNNVKTGLTVKDATITDLINNKSVKTDANGVARLPKAEKTGHGDDMTQDFFKVTTPDGKVSLINNGFSYDNNRPFIYHPSSEGLYWRYMQTDRTLYKPSDTVEFWGYIKSRVDGTTPKDITVELGNGGYYYPMKMGITSRFIPFLSKPLETMELKTEGGFYEGKMNLPSLDPGSYTLTVKSGDEILSSSYISVENYVKPQYKLEISSDKKAVFTGEKITFTIKASFFDGTPVSNVPINYYINGYSSDQGNGTTDAKGILKVEYTPKYQSQMQGQCYFGFQASAQLPETGEISEYYGFQVFANDITFWPQGEITESKGVVNLTVSAVKLDTLNDEDPSNDNIVGAPVEGQSLKLSLYHITWEKVEVGDEYDSINKVVRKLYEYREKKTLIGEADLVTNKDGGAHYEINASNEDGYYIAQITTTDKSGHSMRNDAYLYKNGKGYPAQNDYYYLKAGKDLYKANETVTLNVMNNDKPIKDMRTLFIKSRNGITGFDVKDQPELSEPFLEENAPNYFVDGIIFTGKTYIQTNCVVVYDYNEKRINLEVKTNKTSYKPGETIDVTVKATDKDGKPVSGKVNLSMVDEALLKLSGQYIDPLSTLYGWIESGITRTTNSRGYAEGGYGAPIPTVSVARDSAAGINVSYSKAEPAASEAPRNEAKQLNGGAVQVRADFRDTACFKSLVLDKDGIATYSFKLPDSVTSYSLAAAAISNDLHAGSSIQSTKVSMPFFINDALSLDYLAGDKPYIGVTAYGEDLKENENVSFELAIKELNNYTQKATAKAFQRANLVLPALKEGTYTIEIRAKSESGNVDALSRTITVYPSYRTIETSKVSKLVPNMKVDAGKSGITTLIVTDQGRGKIINYLHSLAWEYGKRLDQRLVAYEARELLKNAVKSDYFNIDQIEVSPSDYKNEDGGYGILPYAGSDMTFTAMITPLLKDVADTTSLKMYFYNTLMSGTKVSAPAIYALAVMGEPVLLDLNKAAAIENLSFDDYLFLGLGYEALGDYESATEIYSTKIAPNLQRMDPYIRVKLTNKDSDTSYRQTALAAVLASKLNSPDANKLYAYVENNYSKTQYVGVEKLLYVADQLKKLADTKASFSYDFGGKTYTQDLSNGYCEIIKIPSVSAKLFHVTKVTGDVSVISLYNTSFTDNAAKDGDIQINRKYYNAATGKETTTFNANDLVKVVITYDLDKTAIDNTYEISDYAPAGLKPVNNPWSYGLKDMFGCWYRQVDGQKVTFVVGKSTDPYKPLVYYARVASPGEFTAEGAVAQGTIVKTSINTTENTKIVINP